MDLNKKIKGSSVTLRVEFEDGTGYDRTFVFDSLNGVNMLHSHPVEFVDGQPIRPNRKSHLTICGYVVGSFNNPIGEKPLRMSEEEATLDGGSIA